MSSDKQEPHKSKYQQEKQKLFTVDESKEVKHNWQWGRGRVNEYGDPAYSYQDLIDEEIVPPDFFND